MKSAPEFSAISVLSISKNAPIRGRFCRARGAIPETLEHVAAHGDVEQETEADQRREERRAAVRQQRERDADHGGEAEDHRDVDHDRPEEEADDADREHRAEAVLRVARDPEPPDQEPEVEREDGHAADEAPLLGEHGEYEVG